MTTPFEPAGSGMKSETSNETGSGLAAAVGGLRDRCDGAVLTPTDDGYTELCTGWNLAWTQRPAVAVHARSESDVVHAVAFAAEHGLAVAVQNSGHGVTIPADEQSLLIITTGLDRVSIDADTRTATIGGGAAWSPVLAEAQVHGLAPLMGSAPHIGAIGYSLGGGFGWLARKHGLAVDSIQSLRVALADGRIVATSPTEESELFWAMCGTTGSSFGVVTELTMTLAPVGEVYAGNLFYAAEDAREVYERYVDWAARSPDELTSAFNITAFPPLDIVPEPIRGKTFTIVRGCYAAEANEQGGGAQHREAESLVNEWREWRQPLMDTWGPMPFARSAEISQDPVDPVPAISSGRWLANLDARVIDAMLAALHGGDGPSPMLFAEIRHGGGAVSRENPAVSYSARDGEWLLEFVGMIVGPGVDVEIERRVGAAWQSLETHLAELPGYLNFVEGHEQVEMSRRTFGADTRARLAEAKRHYDPHGLFGYGIPLEDEAISGRAVS